MLKSFIYLIIFLPLLSFGQSCIDPALVDSTALCPLVIALVCGCDGVTYSNSCEASSYFDVTTWTNGSCLTSCLAEIVPLGPQLICNGIPVDLEVIPADPLASWSDGQIGPLISVTIPGLYSVSITDVYGCVATDSIWVGEDLGCVGMCPDPSLIDSTMMCPLVYAPVCGCDGVTYGNSCEALNYGGVSQYTFGVCVPGCQVDISIVGPSLICNGQGIQLEASFGYVNYQWSGGQTGQTIVVMTPGPIILTATDSTGCTADYTIEIWEDTNCLSVCPDPSLIDSTMMCPLVYAPVCGCDGVTYGNSCEALYYGGVNQYSVGICGSNCLVDIITPGPLMICNSQGVTLEASAGFLNYNWSTGDSGQTIVAIIPGTYEVTAIDSVGCIGISTINVMEDPACSPICIDSDLIDSTALCPTVIDPVCGCDGVTYDNGCLATNNGGVITYTSGACDTSCHVDILPMVPIDICPGQQILLEVSPSGGNITWSTGDTISVIEVSQSGVFSVTVTDVNGCEATNSTEVGLLPNCAPPCVDSSLIDLNFPCPEIYDPVCGCDGVTYDNSCFAEHYGGLTSWGEGSCLPGICFVNIYTQGPAYVCPGDSLMLEASGNMQSFEWTTGETTPFIWVSAAGTYSVTGMDFNGCYAQDSIEVIGYPDCSVCVDSNMIDLSQPCPLFLDPVCGCNGITYGNPCEAQYYGGVLTWSTGACGVNCEVQIVGSEDSICFGDSLMLEVDSGFVSYEWSTGGNGSSEVVHGPGLYSLTVTTLDGCVDTDIIEIVEVVIPLVISYGNPSGGDICAGQEVLLEANTSQDVSWSTGDSLNPATIFPQADTFITVQALTDGCRYYGEVTVMLDSCLNGIEESDIVEFNIFPNPVREFLTIEVLNKESAISSIRIIDLQGRKIWTDHSGEWSQADVISVKQWSSGVYIVEMLVGKEWIREKIVRQ